MAGPVTKEDLWDLRDTLVKQIEAGFRETHLKQDTTNGRVTKAERELDRHDERLKNLQREVFNRRRTDDDPEPPEPPEKPDDDAPITRRDLKVAGYVLAAAASGLGFLFKVLPWAIKAVTP